MGKKWEDQKLGEPKIAVIERIRKRRKSKSFDIKDADHNSPNYSGLSNKQITILAKDIDPSCKGQPYEKKVDIVMKAIDLLDRLLDE